MINYSKNNNQNYENILKHLNILYIEDEKNIRNNMTKTLKMFVQNVFSFEDTENLDLILKNKRIDIIITDINLPYKDGITFVQEIRAFDSNMPIILLTAYTDTKYLLEAVKLKLVDYLTKPIDFKTLQQALYNCVKDIIENARYIIEFPNNISYNVLNKELFNKINQEVLSLSSKELSLLEYFIKHHNRVVSHEEIKNNIWSDSLDYASDAALKNILTKLRKKIGKNTITNISGIGFKIHFL